MKTPKRVLQQKCSGLAGRTESLWGSGGARSRVGGSDWATPWEVTGVKGFLCGVHVRETDRLSSSLFGEGYYV